MESKKRFLKYQALNAFIFEPWKYFLQIDREVKLSAVNALDGGGLHTEVSPYPRKISEIEVLVCSSTKHFATCSTK